MGIIVAINRLINTISIQIPDLEHLIEYSEG